MNASSTMNLIYGIHAVKVRSHVKDVHRDFDSVCVIAEERTSLNGKRFLILSDDIINPIEIEGKNLKFSKEGVIKMSVSRNIMGFLNRNSLQYKYYGTEEKARKILAENSEKSREK